MTERREHQSQVRFPGAQWIASEALTLLALAVGIAAVVGASGLTTVAGRFPMLLGAVVAVLAAAEAVSKFRALQAGADSSSRPWAGRDGALLAWLCATVVLIFALGILPGAFISTALYSRLVERRGLLLSLSLSALNVLVIWLAFAVFAGFELYSGALFE